MKEAGRRDGGGPSAHRAEDLFASWAGRAEGGEHVDFSELVSAHPDLAVELKRLHEDWELFAALLGKVVPGKIAGTRGIVIAPISGADDGPDKAASSELLERLGIHTPASGRYRFSAVIGRGGGGVVLEVWDTKLKRPLAMKVMLGRGEERPTGEAPNVDGLTLTRFVDEARIAGQLNHPGIVPVHDLEADESGRPFFTMKLVKGEDLGRIFDKLKTGEDGWNPTRAVNVLLRVCESVAFAHEKGVIHRDLKPANVMVGKHGEVYVMDWGLARVLGEVEKRDVRVRPPRAMSGLVTVRSGSRGDSPDSPLYTMDGDVVGTPAYMAPEQAAGDIERMGPHSDVYAVGAMLYHLLVGHMPYVPESARLNNYAVWQRVQEGPPDPVEKLSPRTPVELVAICEKAMERRIDQRYRDMTVLAKDLRAFVEGRVVAAHETGAWAEAKKWMGRNRALAVSLSSSIVLLIYGLVVSLGLKARADDALARLAQRQKDAGMWDASAAIGPPDAQAGRDDYRAWAPAFADGGLQWLEVAFASPLRMSSLRIWEVNRSGAIVRIVALSPDGAQHLLWEGSDPTVQPGIFEPAIAAPAFRVKRIRIELDTDVGPGWEEIDAVQISGPDGQAFASDAWASSTYGPSWD